MDIRLLLMKSAIIGYRATIKTGMYKWKLVKLFEPGARLFKRYIMPKDAVVCLPKQGVIEIGENVSQQEMALPPEVIDHFIEQSGYRAILNFCPCRTGNDCRDYPQDHGCLFVGEAARGIHPELARPATKQEAREHIRKGREKGFMNVVGKVWGDAFFLDVHPHKKLMTICCCCPCCCVAVMTPYFHPELTDMIYKMPGISASISAECVGCGKCLEACIFGGIRLDGKNAVITDACRACGRCVDLCPKHAISINIENRDYVRQTIDFIEPYVDVD